MRAVAVRIHDIKVRFTLRRVRTQPKWLSAVTLTSNRSVPDEVADAAMLIPLLLVCRCPYHMQTLPANDTSETTPIAMGAYAKKAPRPGTPQVGSQSCRSMTRRRSQQGGGREKFRLLAMSTTRSGPFLFSIVA